MIPILGFSHLQDFKNPTYPASTVNSQVDATGLGYTVLGTQAEGCSEVGASTVACSEANACCKVGAPANACSEADARFQVGPHTSTFSHDWLVTKQAP